MFPCHVTPFSRLRVMCELGKSRPVLLCVFGDEREGPGVEPAAHPPTPRGEDPLVSALGPQLLSQLRPHSRFCFQLPFHFVHKGIIREFVKCIAATERYSGYSIIFAVLKRS